MVKEEIQIKKKKYTLIHNVAALIKYQKLLHEREKQNDPVEVTAEHALFVAFAGLKENNNYPGALEDFTREVNNDEMLLAKVFVYFSKIVVNQPKENQKKTTSRSIGARFIKKR